MLERLFRTPALPPADFLPDILKELLNHRGPAWKDTGKELQGCYSPAEKKENGFK